jgi:hypothetical protein
MEESVKNFKLYVCSALVISSGLITGCSHDEDSNPGAAVDFSVPSGVDVLKVTDNSGSNYTDPTTDYSLAPQSFHVSHPVGEALSMTSEIMCFIGQLGINNMWSEASLPRVYLVGVNDSKCSSDSGQPAEGAAAGGGSATAATSLIGDCAYQS